MRKPAAGALLIALVLAVAPAFSQEGGEKKEPEHVHETAKESGEHEGKKEAGEGMELWKWANFLLLAGLIGYAIGKNAGPFFDKRSQEIKKEMTEAAAARAAAEARAEEAEKRLANLEGEIAAMRVGLKQESDAEQERLSRQAADEIAKIQAHAEREIESAGKAARSDLKRYSAELALGLAEKKIRARMTPEAEDALVQNFVHDLK
jgi:F-type H+-transporting ATPase subunit b